MGTKLQKISRTIRDIFGSNRYKLEVFPVPGGKKAPFAVICPGGGYTLVMSVIEGEPYARALNKLGYTAFVLRYQTRKKGRFPAPMDDLAKAIHEILENAKKWNVETEGYSVWGSSAGAHLTACFGTKELGYAHYGLPKPAALILCYPVVTMGNHAHKYSRENILGKQPDEAKIAATSVEKNITPSYPPTFLWNSLEDTEVEPVNSQLLADALKAEGILHEYIQFKSGKHGCGLAVGTPCESWFKQAVDFWERAIKR